MPRRYAPIAHMLLVLCAVAGAGAFAYYRWHARQVAAAPSPNKPGDEHGDHQHDAKHQDDHADDGPHVSLSKQARNNLGLVVTPLEATTYWRKIELPGVLTDRPGVSDRGVVAPVTGVVTQIHSHLGETVQPNAPLFALRLTSESLHNSQRELFKATRELEIVRQQRQRLQALAQDGALSQSRVIEIDNQAERLDVTLQAYRQDLLARGFGPEQIAAAAKGDFVTEITVYAPSEETMAQQTVAHVSAAQGDRATEPSFGYEFQELNVALGEQAEAGQVLCHLADHRSLLIEGRGFKEDMPLIQQAAKRGMPIELEFDELKSNEHEGLAWPEPPKRLQIHHVENSIDTQTRTFGFHLVLENQWQTYRRGEHVGLLWRFRPGGRVRLRVAVEQFDNVFVLPQAAVVREGPEAYVFEDEGDELHRQPVHVIAEDRQNVVLASDKSLKPGQRVAANAAASLNRVLRAQLSSGKPAAHVHADGSVHEHH